MNKVIAALIAIATIAFASPALAEYLPGNTEQRDVVDSRDRIIGFLAGENYMASRLELREYSPRVVEDLASVVDDRSMPVEVRERAIDCLALYPSFNRAHEAVASVLEGGSTGSALMDNAILALGQLQGERSVSTLAKFVDERAEDLRAVVVVALGRFGGQEGFELLKELSEVEESEVVRAQISRYID